MLNLKTVPTSILQAHLDRIKDAEEFLALLVAGEVLEGNAGSVGMLTGRITMIREARVGIVSLHNVSNGVEE